MIRIWAKKNVGFDNTGVLDSIKEKKLRVLTTGRLVFGKKKISF